jgi:hypothetical protein
MGWKPISTAPKDVQRYDPVDLWMTVYPSPASMGISDAFRITDCWKGPEGKWTHDYKGSPAELNQLYITHWMPLPKPPGRRNK